MFDIYDFLFLLTTVWIGPFWFAMLVYPEHEVTKKAVSGPWLYVGPLVCWVIVVVLNPSQFLDLFASLSPSMLLEELAKLLGTKAGAVAAWTHMVAGDIFITRWIWKKCVENNVEVWKMRISVFLAVMMMPVGFIFYSIVIRKNHLVLENYNI